MLMLISSLRLAAGRRWWRRFRLAAAAGICAAMAGPAAAQTDAGGLRLLIVDGTDAVLAGWKIAAFKCLGRAEE